MRFHIWMKDEIVIYNDKRTRRYLDYEILLSFNKYQLKINADIKFEVKS